MNIDLFKRSTDKEPLIILYEYSCLNYVLELFALNKVFPYKVVFFNEIITQFDYLAKENPNTEIEEIIAMTNIVTQYFDSNVIQNVFDILNIYNEIKEIHRDFPNIQGHGDLLKNINQIIDKFESSFSLTLAEYKSQILLKLSDIYEIFEVGILVKKKFFSCHIISLYEEFNLYEELKNINLDNLIHYKIDGKFEERQYTHYYKSLYKNLYVVFNKKNLLFSKFGNILLMIIRTYLYNLNFDILLSLQFFDLNYKSEISNIVQSMKNLYSLLPYVLPEYRSESFDNMFLEISNIIDEIIKSNLRKYIYQIIEFILSHRYEDSFNIYYIDSLAFIKNEIISMSDSAIKTRNINYLSTEMRVNLNLITEEDLEKKVNFSFVNIVKYNRVIFLSTYISRFFMILKNLKNYNTMIPLSKKSWVFIAYLCIIYKPKLDEEFFVSDIKSVSFTALSLLSSNLYQFYLIHILKCRNSSMISNINALFGIALHKLFDEYNLSYDSFTTQESKVHFCQNNFNYFDYFDDKVNFINSWIAFDDMRRQISIKIETEKYLETYIDNVKLYGFIDRFEIGLENEITLIDFKTGVVPSTKMINNGLDLQLLSQSYAIYKNFMQLPHEVLYVKVSTSKPYFVEKKVKLNYENFDKLIQTVKILQKPYLNYQLLENDNNI